MAKAKPAWTNDPYQLPWRKVSGVGRWPARTLKERFEEKIVYAESGCWEWSAAHTPQGYGQFHMKLDGEWKPVLAHRISYQLYVGPIAKGLWIDHLCRNRGCLNPGHLEAVTPRINLLRGMAPSAVSARENQCHRGHEFTPENTYVKPGSPGKRECRECVRARDRARGKTEKTRARRRAAYRRRKGAASA